MSVFIHEDARVQSTTIGEGTRIWQFAIVLVRARIGAECNISSHVLVENDVALGDRVTVKSGVQLWDGVTAEDDVFIGPNATFTNDFLPRSRQPGIFRPTLLRRNCSIGANATIVCGVTIGRFALVGAGSVVTSDIPDYELWYGNPARRRARVDERGEVVERFDAPQD